MKTVTVTTQNALNYGAVLQAYALQRVLREIGADDALLDLKRFSNTYFYTVHTGKLFFHSLYENLYVLRYIYSLHKKAVRFSSFVKNHIATTQYYKSKQAVIDDPPDADVYITGSDQMFNTYNGIDKTAFLKFGDSSIRRISYATSKGTLEVADAYKNDFIRTIRAYKSVSVREECLRDTMRKYGVSCDVHVDPSLLLSASEWMEIVPADGGKHLDDRYILVYALRCDPCMEKLLLRLKEKTNMQAVILSASARCRLKGDLIIRDAGPLEFLRLVHDASFILTNSFHGTCFSVVFEKDFYSIARDKGETRINGLLDLLGLGERIISKQEQITLEGIPYARVNARLDIERQRARQYLKTALDIKA